MKKTLITLTALLSIIAGSTSSYASGSCTSDVWGGGFTCKDYSSGSTTHYTPNVWGGGWSYNTYDF